MKAALILAACLSTLPASAQTSVWLHGLSEHSSERSTGQPWNERNLGLGLRYELTEDWSVQGGFYKNSLGRQTEYLLAQWQPLSLGSVQAGLFAGYASGYTAPWPAAAGFMITAPITVHVLAGFRLIPPINKITPAVLAFDLAWRF